MAYQQQAKASFLYEIRNTSSSRQRPSIFDTIMAQSENRRPRQQKAPKKKRGR